MKQKQTTMDGFEPNYDRRSGNSTRQIDYAIQLLFSGKIVKVVDHASEGRRRVNQMLFNRIRDRLHFEHKGAIEWIKFDTKNLEIYLLD